MDHHVDVGRPLLVAEDQRDGLFVPSDEHQRRDDAADHATIAQLHVLVFHRLGGVESAHRVGHHLREARPHMVPMGVEHADRLAVGKDSVQSELEIRAIGNAEVRRVDRQMFRLLTEMLPQAAEEKLADYVDSKMRTVAEQTSTVDSLRLAVLAARPRGAASIRPRTWRASTS